MGAYAFETRTEGPYNNGEEFNPAWDVDYDETRFWFAGTGYPTQDEACEAYEDAEGNPTTYEGPGADGDVERFETMAEACDNRSDYVPPAAARPPAPVLGGSARPHAF
jgi:hypothetical protein